MGIDSRAMTPIGGHEQDVGAIGIDGVRSLETRNEARGVDTREVVQPNHRILITGNWTEDAIGDRAGFDPDLLE